MPCLEETVTLRILGVIVVNIYLFKFFSQQKMDPAGKRVLTNLAEEREHLPRDLINRICDRVPIPNGIGDKARNVALNNVVEMFRDQFANVKLPPKLVPYVIAGLEAEITTKELAARIADNCPIGLRAAEALTAGLGQLSMSAFKSTDQAEQTLMAAVNLMQTLTRVTKFRPDMKCEIHYNSEYAQEGNFNIIDIADMRETFLSKSVSDLLMKYTSNHADYDLKRNGYTIGVMNIKGQDISDKVKKERQELIDDWNYPIIEPMRWNYLGSKLDRDKVSSQCRLMLRLYLDPQIMYSMKVSMPEIIQKIGDSTDNSRIRRYIMASSFSEGIIDIFPGKGLHEDVPDVPRSNAEKIFLGTTFIESLIRETVGGIPGVLAVHIARIDMVDYLSFHKVNPYTISEIGRREFIKGRKVDVFTDTIEWEDIEKNAILVSKEEYDLKNNSYIGEVDGMDCILPFKISAERHLAAPHPTGNQLTHCYLQIFGKIMGLSEEQSTWENLKNKVKVIGVNNKLYIDGVKLNLVEKLLYYCGIRIKHKELHSRLLNVIQTLYVVSEEHPESIIKRHRELSSYNFDDIFTEKKDKVFRKKNSIISKQAAKRLLYLKKKNKITKADDFKKALVSAAFLDLGRIFNYCYNIAEIIKVTTVGPKNAVEEFVTQLPFWDILRYPFVDKERTTCNNWNSMVIATGVGAACNWHLYELTTFLKGCGESNAKRHIVCLSDFIWEKGRPYGVNLYGIKKHGFGIMTILSFEGAGREIWSAFYKKPESVTNFAVSGLTGTEPVGDRSMIQKLIAVREKEVAEKRARLSIRLGNQHTKTDDTKLEEATNDDAISIEAMSILMRQNPEQSIETFVIERALVPDAPEDIVIVDKYYQKNIFESIKRESQIALNILRNLMPYEEEKIEVTLLPVNSGFFNIDTLFKLLTNLKSHVSLESEEELEESDDIFAEGNEEISEDESNSS